MTQAPISAETLRRLLKYDARTGYLYWKLRGIPQFDAQYGGQRALCTPDKDGYLRGKVEGTSISAHRAIVMMMTNIWPEQIDHENGDRSDNRLQNLKASDHAGNGRNQGINTRNKSGVSGVYWSDAHGKWIAQIGYAGRRRHLGVFDSLREAKAAKEEAARRFGFHVGHGQRNSWGRSQDIATLSGDEG